MPKAIFIIGSPRAQGSTAVLTGRIADGMTSIGVDVQRHLLGEMDIRYCRGCWACADSRQCVQQDDVAAIVQDIIAADIVVMASPSYWGDVTAQLKAFIDRCSPYCNTRPGGTTIPPGKLGIAVAIRAGHSGEENLHLIGTIEHYFGHLDIKPVARLTVEGVGDVSDLEQKPAKLQEAYALGVRIAQLVGHLSHITASLRE